MPPAAAFFNFQRFVSRAASNHKQRDSPLTFPEVKSSEAQERWWAFC